ncbi:MAG: NAD(P)-binding protein, partial [Dehalococcoidia bacterium]
YQPPHCTQFAEGDRNAQFRAEKAKGGFGLIVQEWSSVHPSSDYIPIRSGIIWDESLLGEHKKMTDAVHRYGAKFFLQLVHQGVQTAFFGSQTKEPPLAPSPVQDVFYVGQGKEMEEEDIEEIINAFARCAVLAKMAGYDGVEIHAAHGYLIAEFLSPLYNKRTDRWGGSLQNRVRFFREVLRRVRKAVGPDMAVSARFTYDERLPTGIKPDEGLEMMVMVNDLVDFWDIDWGEYATIGEMIPPARNYPENYQIEATAEIRRKLHERCPNKKTPVGGCGRIRNPDDALRMISEGQLDMVGMVRQSIADPHWPRKVREGRVDEIRECSYNNTCLAGLFTYRAIECVQNASAGEEYKGFYPEEFAPAPEKKMVLVVGGGATGMEVARVAAARGHTVDLHEAQENLGGHTSLLARLPGCAEWARVVEYRERMVRKLGVTVHTKSPLTASQVLEYGADAVVFATGADWDRTGNNPLTKEPIPGYDKPHVLVPEDILSDGKTVGKRVLIVDSDAYLMGVGLADILASQGKEVTLVAYPNVGYYLLITMELGAALRRLAELKVRMLPQLFAAQITDDGADLFNIWTMEGQSVQADNVILSSRRVPRTSLYREVKAKAGDAGPAVHLTGEAISPKTFFSMSRAMYWAHKLGRSL